MNLRFARTDHRFLLAALAVLLFAAGLLAGCSGGAKTASAPTGKKAMLEAVATWYVALGQVDLDGYKAGIYDPDNVTGVASMTTPPAGAQKMQVDWKWQGDSILLTIPSQQTTLTMTASPNQDNVVILKDATGQTETFVMKKVGDAWKIDVPETQKASEAAVSGSSEGSSSKEATKSK